MRAFWFGVSRGFALLVYLVIGALYGIADGWDDWKSDTDRLREIRREIR